MRRFPPNVNFPVRGAGPMAAPLQDPNAGHPNLDSQYSASDKLVDGSPRLLCKLQYESPRSCGVAVCVPLINFGGQAPLIESTANAELWVLGKAIVGIGGTNFVYEFDMPAGQVVQLAHVASYLEVSARLIAVPVAIQLGGAGPWVMQDFQFPPMFTGRAIRDVQVLATGGEEGFGLCNPTRHARFPTIGAAAAAQCQAPPWASSVQILAKSDSTFQWTVSRPAPAANVVYGPAPVPASMCCKVPCPEGVIANLTVTPTGNIAAELIWRLGFVGFVE